MGGTIYQNNAAIATQSYVTGSFQPLNSHLTTVSSLTQSSGSFVTSSGTDYQFSTPAQVSTILGLGALATLNSVNLSSQVSGTLTNASLPSAMSTSSLNLTATTNATTATTGALIVAGGIGLGGSIFAGTNLTVNGTANLNGVTTVSGANQTMLAVTSTYSSGTVVPITGYVSTLATNGSVTFNVGQSSSNNAGFGFNYTGGTGSAINYTFVGIRSDVLSFDPLRIYSTKVTVVHTTDSSSTVTGSLVLSGGAGIAKSLYVGTNLNVAGTTILTGTTTVPTPVNTTDAGRKDYIDGLSYLTASTGLTKTGSSLSVNASQNQITSVGTLTSLSIAASISSPLTVSTTYNAAGPTVIQAYASSIGTNNDSQIAVGVSGTDCGYFGYSYVGGTGASSNFAFMGIRSDANVPHVFSAYSDHCIVNLTGDASSSTSGSLQVAGGVGISKNLWVGAGITGGTVSVTNTTDSSSTVSGALQIVGGVGIGKTLMVGNAMSIPTTANNPYVSVGSSIFIGFCSNGGAYVNGSAINDGVVNCRNGDLWLGGFPNPCLNISVAGICKCVNTTDSSSSTTGSFQFLGGIGISKSLYVAGTTSTATVQPTSDNVSPLGGTSKRWTAVYAVNGTIQTSDVVMKTDIVQLDQGLDFVKKLKPITYKMKAPNADKNGQAYKNVKHYVENLHMGLSAQDVLEAVKGTSIEKFAGIEKSVDGTYMMNYSHFVAPLVKAIQELAMLEKDRVSIEYLKSCISKTN